MISAPKSAAFRASVQIFNNSLVSASPVVSNKVLKVNVQKPLKENVRVPNSAVSASVSIFGPSQVRMAHTDVTAPNFDDYRKNTSLHKENVNEKQVSGKMFQYIVAGAGLVGAIHMGTKAIPGYLGYLAPAKDVLAMAQVEIKLDSIPEGKSMVFKWRGKPLFIRHRSAEEIETERAVNLSELRDPQHDSDRVTEPKWMVVIGICTHLGCVPVADAGDFGGYYCPCHGSHYDTSGRIRKGPAPLNLEVPRYQFLDDTTLVVG